MAGRKSTHDFSGSGTQRLGVWAGALGGDSGMFLKTHRTPTDPLKPEYVVVGQTVADPAEVGSPRRLTAPPGPLLARVWKEPEGGGSIVSYWNSLEAAKQTWPTSPNKRYEAASRASMAKVQAAAAEVAALP